jgi:DNA-binding Lrp family transcriptional regulator
VVPLLLFEIDGIAETFLCLVGRAQIGDFMITAYILVATTIGKEKTVAEELQKLKEVELADILYGEWDIILRVKVESLAELDTFLTQKIRKKKNIKLTSTLIAS